MSTYLLTWNPARWAWDELEDLAKVSRKGKIVERRWSCGNNKNIQAGSRVFLLRQGNDRPGLIASGWVTKSSYWDWPWDERVRRKKSLFIKADWYPLRHIDAGLPRANLLDGILPQATVDTRAGGVKIDSDFAAALEKAWAEHVGESVSIPALARLDISAWEGEPIETSGYRPKRDRRLCDRALDNSRGVCSCCETDYSKILNGEGVRVLQVHHKKQFGYRDKPRLTKVSDLAVICANCHRLIHANLKQALPVEALRRRLKAGN